MTNTPGKKIHKTWAGNFLLIFASFVIALLLGELMVRMVMPQDLRFNVTQWDEFTGFWHIPNIEGYTKHRDYTMFVTINSKGLRDRERPYSKPSKTIRVGVFGDSFTFGEGVQNDETYPALIESLYMHDPAINAQDWNVEVINFGVGKTGTSHQYALYLKEGRKYDLDVAVLGFLGGNDFSDNIQGVFRLNDGELEHDPAAYSSMRRIQSIVYRIPFYKWLASNSHLVNLARIMATRSDDRTRGQRASERNIGGDNNSSLSKPDIDSSQLTESLLAAFRDNVEKDGAVFVFMNLPSKLQASDINRPGNENAPAYLAQTERLLEVLEISNFNTLDLVPVFSRLNIDSLYFQNDGHMNSAGHKVIAANLKRFLDPYVLGLAVPGEPHAAASTSLRQIN